VEIDPRMVGPNSGLRDTWGIVVAARTSGARSEVPLLPRDVIRTLNNTRILTLDQLRTAVGALKPGMPATLQVQRDGRLMFVSFTLD
jgi:S1-C subfamily serine protease